MWKENVQNFLRGEDDKAVDCIAKGALAIFCVCFKTAIVMILF